MIDMQLHWGDRSIHYPYELASKIIHEMQAHGKVTLLSKENRSAASTGLYDLLDQLCKFWGWNKSNITIDTTTWSETHPEYTIVVRKISHAACFNEIPKFHITWNKKKCYGLFSGRATAIRSYAIQKHLEHKYRDLGLTTFNESLIQSNDKIEILDYCMHSGRPYSELLSLSTYNDLGPVLPPPITPPLNVRDWAYVYSNIGVEIICETSAHVPPNNDTSSYFCQTEKLLRPLINKKPFFLVAGGSTSAVIRDIGFTTFEEYFGHYEAENGFRTLDAIFDILERSISDGSFNDIIAEAQEGAEKNFQRYFSYADEMGWTKESWDSQWASVYSGCEFTSPR